MSSKSTVSRQRAALHEESQQTNAATMSSWDRRKQYMANMYSRRKLMVQKTATKRKMSEKETKPEPSQPVAADFTQKENVPGPTKPKRLCHSSSYTILPSDKSLATGSHQNTQSTNTVTAEMEHLTEGSCKATSANRHLSSANHKTDSPVIRQNTFTISKVNQDQPKNTKINKTSEYNLQNAGEIRQDFAAEKVSIPRKRMNPRVIPSRYMKGIFSPIRRQTIDASNRIPTTKAQAGSHRATISTVQLSQGVVSDVTHGMANAPTRSCTSLCKPKPTRTSLLRQKMQCPTPIITTKTKKTVQVPSHKCMPLNMPVTDSKSKKTCEPSKLLLKESFDLATKEGVSKHHPCSESTGYLVSLETEVEPIPVALDQNIGCSVPQEINTPNRPKSVQFVAPINRVTPSNITIRKTPKKNLTLRERFEVWMSNKDVSPSKYRHLRCFGIQLSEFKRQKQQHGVATEKRHSKKQENNAAAYSFTPRNENKCEPPMDIKHHSAANEAGILSCIDVEVRSVLPELKQMLIDGYDPKDIRGWLEELQSSTPSIKQEVMFWECKALVNKFMGDMNKALKVFNEAVEHGIEPADQLATALSELLSSSQLKDDKDHPDKMSPLSPEHLQSPRPKPSASVIRYSVDKTPKIFKKLSRALDLNSPEYMTVITPVRRSIRLKNCTPGRVNQLECVDSLENLPPEVKKKSLLRKNIALEIL